MPQLHRGSKGSAEHGGTWQAESEADMHSSTSSVPFFLLAALAAIGTALLLAVAGGLGLEKDTVPYVFVEHLGSALLVGAILGFTYEWLLHRKREQYIETLVSKQMEATATAVKDLISLSPQSVLGLVKAIASRIGGTIPTLYTPARGGLDEYTLAGDISYFASLVRANRKDVVEVLREWLQEGSDFRLKFLASDFVGHFRLEELRGDLERQISFSDWEEIDLKTRAWRLNYAWAYSRSAERMYWTLGDLARTTPYREVEEWILFIPQQMKDREFLRVLDAYLSRADVDTDRVRMAIRPLASLWQADPQWACDIVKRHAHLFDPEAARKELDIRLRQNNVSPEPVLATVGTNAHRASSEMRKLATVQSAGPQD